MNASIGEAMKSSEPHVYLGGSPSQMPSSSRNLVNGNAYTTLKKVWTDCGLEFPTLLADLEEEGRMVYADELEQAMAGGNEKQNMGADDAFGAEVNFLNEDGDGSSNPEEQYHFHQENVNTGAGMVVPPGPSEVKPAYNYYPMTGVDNKDGNFRYQGNENMTMGNRSNFAIDKKQKRKIKNRESAARSRARKLAYNSQLEIEIERLKQENARLKRDKLFNEIAAARGVQRMRVLRRTFSSPP